MSPPRPARPVPQSPAPPGATPSRSALSQLPHVSAAEFFCPDGPVRLLDQRSGLRRLPLSDVFGPLPPRCTEVELRRLIRRRLHDCCTQSVGDFHSLPPHASDLRQLLHPSMTAGTPPLPSSSKPVGPLRVDVWDRFHSSACASCREAPSPDCYWARYLRDSVQYGFRLPIPSAFSCDIPEYDQSAEDRRDADHLLQAQVDRGSVLEIAANPACTVPTYLLRKAVELPPERADDAAFFSGGRPMKEKLRLITDLSCKRGGLKAGPNGVVARKRFRYLNLAEALAQLTPGCFVASVDLQDGYFSAPVHPLWRRFLCIRHRRRVWQFMSLPFGWCLACWQFSSLTSEVASWLRHRFPDVWVGVYLDDFLLVAADRSRCQEAYDWLLRTLTEAGFIASSSKCCPPCQRLEFLGCVIDSRSMYAELPPARQAKYKAAVDRILASAATRQPLGLLRQLAGQLCNAAALVPFGISRAAGLSRAIASAHAASSCGFRLPADVVQDLRWWSARLSTPLRLPLLDPASDPRVAVVFTDASGGGGLGFHFGSVDGVASSADRTSSTEVELAAIVFAIRANADALRGRTVLVATDSRCAFAAVAKGSAGPGGTSAIRKLQELCDELQLLLVPAWVRRSANTHADALSKQGNAPSSATFSL